MQTIKNLCVGFVNCIHKCFKSQKEEYRDRMIELEERIYRPPPHRTQPDQNNIFAMRLSEPQQITPQQSPKKLSQTQQIQDQVQVHNNDPIRSSKRSSDSFFTVNSGNRSSQSISRRTFKSIKAKRSLRLGKQVSDFKNSEFKDMINDNMSLSGHNEVELVRVNSEFNNIPAALIEWNEKQYGKSNFYSPLTSTEQQKIASNLFLDEAVNKLEDYYTFYFNELNSKFQLSGQREQKKFSPYKGWMFRKSPEVKFSYTNENENMNMDNQFFMTLITFQCNTSNTMQFLKWYNSQLTQAKLFNFQQIRLLQNGNEPIFEIQQFGSDLLGKNSYTTFRQIQTVKFDNDPDVQYILQLDSTFRKGKQFKSLLRFSSSDNCIVQIYCQSSEKLKYPSEDCYARRWEIIQKFIKERTTKLLASRFFK